MATIKLKNSSGVSGGAAKAPSTLEVGEVAINNATNYESLFLKNSSNSIIKLPINYLKGVTSDVQTQLNGKAATSHTHNYLPISGTAVAASKLVTADNRSTPSTPEYYNSMGIYSEFKTNANAGISDGGSYTGLLTFRKYGTGADFSGGKSGQLAFTDNSNIWCRFGKDTTWESWHKIYHSGNLDVSNLANKFGNVGYDFNVKELNVNGNGIHFTKYGNASGGWDGADIYLDNEGTVDRSKLIFKLSDDTSDSFSFRIASTTPLNITNTGIHVNGDIRCGNIYNNYVETDSVSANMLSILEDAYIGGEMGAEYGNFGECTVSRNITSGGDVIAYSGSPTAMTLEYNPEEDTTATDSPTALDILIDKCNRLEKQNEYLMKEINNLKN